MQQDMGRSTQGNVSLSSSDKKSSDVNNNLILYNLPLFYQIEALKQKLLHSF